MLLLLLLLLLLLPAGDEWGGSWHERTASLGWKAHPLHM
jgi:hypothetical protein